MPRADTADQGGADQRPAHPWREHGESPAGADSTGAGAGMAHRTRRLRGGYSARRVIAGSVLAAPCAGLRLATAAVSATAAIAMAEIVGSQISTRYRNG